MWNKIKNVKNIINSSDINAIVENQIELVAMIHRLGEEIGFVDISIAPNIPYKNVKAKYITIERNFDRLNESTFQSIYYVRRHVIGDYEPNRQEWQRWINILNDMYSIVTGKKNKWCKLLCNDGYPTIKGKKIIVRGNK